MEKGITSIPSEATGLIDSNRRAGVNRGYIGRIENEMETTIKELRVI